MMHFELLDSLSIPGDPAKPNEDSFAHRANLGVVFDGATPLSENLLPGPSDAQWIARFAARRLTAHAADTSDAPRDWLRAAAADAEKSYAALRWRAPAAPHEAPFASMMAAALHTERLCALWFGDCALIVKPASGPVALIGDTLTKRDAERLRVRKVAAMAKRGPAASGVRAEFMPVLRAARDQVNSGRGSWLFGADETCAEHVLSAEREIDPGDVLLLATDGLLTLISDYDRYDPQGLIEAVQTRGLTAVTGELRAIEAGDPDGENFPRFKKSDDVTGLLLRVVT
jgi:hypothetical protein